MPPAGPEGSPRRVQQVICTLKLSNLPSPGFLPGLPPEGARAGLSGLDREAWGGEQSPIRPLLLLLAANPRLSFQPSHLLLAPAPSRSPAGNDSPAVTLTVPALTCSGGTSRRGDRPPGASLCGRPHLGLSPLVFPCITEARKADPASSCTDAPCTCTRPEFALPPRLCRPHPALPRLELVERQQSHTRPEQLFVSLRS